MEAEILDEIKKTKAILIGVGVGLGVMILLSMFWLGTAITND